MNKPLQLALFGPGTLDTVELTEVYGDKPGGIFDFIDKDLKAKQIKTCYGDLIIMINALEDYSNILRGVINEWGLTGVHKHMYKYHAARCRKIARHYANEIGYDYDEAVRDCQKARARAEKSDVGEDALTLATKGKEGVK